MKVFLDLEIIGGRFPRRALRDSGVHDGTFAAIAEQQELWASVLLQQND
jgi:hypothetical protein